MYIKIYIFQKDIVNIFTHLRNKKLTMSLNVSVNVNVYV